MQYDYATGRATSHGPQHGLGQHHSDGVQSHTSSSGMVTTKYPPPPGYEEQRDRSTRYGTSPQQHDYSMQQYYPPGYNPQSAYDSYQAYGHAGYNQQPGCQQHHQPYTSHGPNGYINNQNYNPQHFNWQHGQNYNQAYGGGHSYQNYTHPWNGWQNQQYHQQQYPGSQYNQYNQYNQASAGGHDYNYNTAYPASANIPHWPGHDVSRNNSISHVSNKDDDGGATFTADELPEDHEDYCEFTRPCSFANRDLEVDKSLSIGQTTNRSAIPAHRPLPATWIEANELALRPAAPEPYDADRCISSYHSEERKEDELKPVRETSYWTDIKDDNIFAILPTPPIAHLPSGYTTELKNYYDRLHPYAIDYRADPNKFWPPRPDYPVDPPPPRRRSYSNSDNHGGQGKKRSYHATGSLGYREKSDTNKRPRHLTRTNTNQWSRSHKRQSSLHDGCPTPEQVARYELVDAEKKKIQAQDSESAALEANGTNSEFSVNLGPQGHAGFSTPPLLKQEHANMPSSTSTITTTTSSSNNNAPDSSASTSQETTDTTTRKVDDNVVYQAETKGLSTSHGQHLSLIDCTTNQTSATANTDSRTVDMNDVDLGTVRTSSVKASATKPAVKESSWTKRAREYQLGDKRTLDDKGDGRGEQAKRHK